MHTDSQNRPPRVIIVGGGIGGLSAAIALRGRGHDVVVLERAPRLESTGAGITLFANAMDALGGLGVAQSVAAAGAAATRSAILTSDGRELTMLPADLLEGAVAVHRGDLQAALLGAAGEVRLGVEITSVHQTPDGVVAHAADGTDERGDLLIGPTACGRRSARRSRPPRLATAGTPPGGVSRRSGWRRVTSPSRGEQASGSAWSTSGHGRTGSQPPTPLKARLMNRASGGPI